MVITHHGGQCFKVTFGDTTLLFDPPSKEAETLKPVKFGADVVLVSKNHPDFNGVDTAKRGDKEPFAITGPGAYEVGGITVRGYQTASAHGGVDGLNTMYVVELESMTLVFLGALSESTLPQEARELLDEIDVLFVPVGGDGVLSPDDAHKLAVKLEPRIIIPMHHEGLGEKDALKQFAKEDTTEKPVDKLTLKKRDVAGRNGDIMIVQAV